MCSAIRNIPKVLSQVTIMFHRVQPENPGVKPGDGDQARSHLPFLSGVQREDRGVIPKARKSSKRDSGKLPQAAERKPFPRCVARAVIEEQQKLRVPGHGQ